MSTLNKDALGFRASTKETFFWKYAKMQQNNLWFIEEYSLASDKAHLHKLSVEEKDAIGKAFTFGAVSDAPIGINNKSLADIFIMPEAQAFFSMQAMVENFIHQESYFELLNNIVGHPEWAEPEHYMKLKPITDKIDFAEKYAISDDSSAIAILKNIIAYYMGMEGIFFSTIFHVAVAPSAVEKETLNQTAAVIQKIFSDEIKIHFAFGLELLRNYAQEQHLDPMKYAPAIIQEAADLESEFCDWVIGDMRNLVLNKSIMHGIIEHTRASILKAIETGKAPNPFCNEGWAFNKLESKDDRNFFETRVNDYKIGGLQW